jgi:ribosomal protein S30
VPTHEDCQRELDALDLRLKKLAGGRRPEAVSGSEDMDKYSKLRKQIEVAIKKPETKPEKILPAIGSLEPMYRKALEALAGLQAQAAKAERDTLKESSTQADTTSTEAYKAAERRGLFELRKQLKLKADQIPLLEANKKKELVPKKKLEYDGRISKATEELAALNRQLEPLAELGSTYDAAKRESDSLKEQLRQSQQRVDDLAVEQAAQERQCRARAAELEARCQRIAKDGDLPAHITLALGQATEAILASNFVKAEWALEDLPALLEAEERRLRETHPERDVFLEKLDALDGPIDKVLEEELTSEADKAEVNKTLNAAVNLAKQRKYAQATLQAAALEALLVEVNLRIKATRLAQIAFETALDGALDDIGFYLEGDNVDQEDVEKMNRLVEQTRSIEDFVAARAFVNTTLKPAIEKCQKAQDAWRKSGKPARVRRPPSPPNYDEAADWIVQQALAGFRRNFAYAGPSVDVEEIYPREKYDPVRLKRVVRSRFDGLTPGGALPTMGLSAKCYFNLGAGGTTKKQYEYNVKVKLPGVARALAQIHVVYP